MHRTGEDSLHAMQALVEVDGVVARDHIYLCALAHIEPPSSAVPLVSPSPLDSQWSI
eukprot:COSAG01_NODE_7981_length_2965_cov_5.062805_5_plen_57_part_00